MSVGSQAGNPVAGNRIAVHALAPTLLQCPKPRRVHLVGRMPTGHSLHRPPFYHTHPLPLRIRSPVPPPPLYSPTPASSVLPHPPGRKFDLHFVLVGLAAPDCPGLVVSFGCVDAVHARVSTG